MGKRQGLIITLRFFFVNIIDLCSVNIIHLTDLDHPGVLPYARLTEAQLRNRLEPDKGIFICESPKVIRVALDAGYQPLSLLTEEKFLDTQAADIIARCPDMPVYTGSRQLLASLTGYELTRGVLCAMRRPQLPSAQEILSALPTDKPLRVALLDNVVNSTNTGAIFRAAAALGVDALLLTPTCCDPLNRRSVRVSMGTVFQIPWTYFDGGTEGDGLSRHIIDQCDYRVIIPMSNHVDSLNVAGAASVAFWQLCQR